jgi:NitT/TauT family transport system permease protein
MRRLWHHIEVIVYPLAALALLIALWHWLVVSGRVPTFLLPSPPRVVTSVAGAVTDGTLSRHLASTLQAAGAGYLIGTSVALLLAALVAEYKVVERFLLLHLIAFQSIPKVSIAPLIFLWAGFGLGGKVILVSLICFFPVFANALAGFRAADRNLVDLMRVAGASRIHLFYQVRLPGALSYIFAGLEVAVTFALIGCIVMEFIGSTAGIGFLIQETSTMYDLPLTFGVIVVIGLIGVLANGLVRALRGRLLFWEVRKDRPTGAAGGQYA